MCAGGTRRIGRRFRCTDGGRATTASDDAVLTRPACLGTATKRPADSNATAPPTGTRRRASRSATRTSRTRVRVAEASAARARSRAAKARARTSRASSTAQPHVAGGPAAIGG